MNPKIKLLIGIGLIVVGLTLSIIIGVVFNENEGGTGIVITGNNQPGPFGLCCGGMIM